MGADAARDRGRVRAPSSDASSPRTRSTIVYGFAIFSPLVSTRRTYGTRRGVLA